MPLPRAVSNRVLSSPMHNICAADAVGKRIRPKQYGMPERGRPVPELKQFGMLAYRQIIIRPWRIFYRCDADRV